ncbi:MAG: contractile injection system tape measure protein [Kofleriaceae bacterium]
MTAHRINRLELELLVEDPARARALSDRVSGMHRGRIATLLDRVCGDLDGDVAPLRLERLEVELGVLAADSFEADLLDKLEAALRAKLATARSRRPLDGAPRAAAALELLETFALTGGLPWWAEPQEVTVVARHVAQAVVEAPAELVALLRRLAGDSGALDRLARACDAAALAGLAGGAGTSTSQASAYGALDRDARRALLRALAHGGPRPDAAGSAARQPLVPSAGAVSAGPQRSSTLQTPPAAPETPPLAPPSSTPAPPASAPRSPTAPRLARTSPPESPRSAASPVRPSTPTSAAASEAPEAPVTVPCPRARPAITVDATHAARRRMLERLDELYVDDAGLVLLWPFLGRCFIRAGLLGADGAFLDEAAQLQAVALTSALAAADPDPSEPRLPLAKLLCGRPLESDFQLTRPLAPAQLAECELLLAAALDHARSLGDLSPDALRAAFLRRRGALSTRDGAWLLQVERRDHDVVLDRVPWTWSWIRLPWMPHPLRVEW